VCTPVSNIHAFQVHILFFLYIIKYSLHNRKLQVKVIDLNERMEETAFTNAG